MPYKVLDHTADTGLEIQEPDLATLFITAAHAMTEIITDSEITAQQRTQVTLQADNVEELFHDWLSEINYLLQTHEKVFCEFEIKKITPTEVSAECRGETFSCDTHSGLAEIKAVTYHRLVVEKRDDNWYARVYFDL